MSDLDTARENLKNHSICLCRNGEIIVSDKRGISPMMGFISQGLDLEGYSAADIITGKAAAMLFVKAGIVSVYSKVMSYPALDYLKEHGITADYGELTERIINRTGDDICPMEKTVMDIEDFETGYEALRKKLDSMK